MMSSDNFTVKQIKYINNNLIEHFSIGYIKLVIRHIDSRVIMPVIIIIQIIMKYYFLPIMAVTEVKMGGGFLQN